MLSDSAILKKIERQPKRTAGFKQLVRELGLHGKQRSDLNELLDRMPDLAYAGGHDRLRSNFINGIKRIPVTYTPSKPVLS